MEPSQVRTRLSLERDGFEPGSWRQAVGPVMESVRLLQMPAGRLSHSTSLRGCKVPRSRKREHGLAPLSPCGPSLILGVEFPLDAFFWLTRPRAGLSARDKRFESVSLQHRINVEPKPPTLISKATEFTWLMNPCREIAFE
jgi:hypothetical protein